MFRVRQSVILPCGLLLLASFSRPLFTSVHNRFAKPHSRVGLIPGTRRVPKRINSTPTTESYPSTRAQPRTNRFTSEIHCEERRSNDVSHRKRSGFLVAARPSFPRTRESRSSHRRPTGDELLWPPNFGRGFGLDIIDSGPRNPDSQTPLLSPQSTIANRQLATSMKLVGGIRKYEGRSRPLARHQQLLHWERSRQVAHEYPTLR